MRGPQPSRLPLLAKRATTSTSPRPLIVTNRDDHTADWLIREFEEREAPFVRLNTEDFPRDIRLIWRSSGEHLLELYGDVYPLSVFRSVWYRRPVAPRPDAAGDPGLVRWAAVEAREALDGLWRTHEAVWVNHPAENLNAGIKQEQLVRASSMGFAVPETLVTNDLAAVRNFAAAHSRGTICKPLRMGRLLADDQEQLFFTSPVSEEDLQRFKDGQEPYLFQELVEKTYDIRVTVIGAHCFATRIDSQVQDASKVDWRRSGGGLGHSAETLPRNWLSCVETWWQATDCDSERLTWLERPPAAMSSLSSIPMDSGPG